MNLFFKLSTVLGVATLLATNPCTAMELQEEIAKAVFNPQHGCFNQDTHTLTLDPKTLKTLYTSKQMESFQDPQKVVPTLFRHIVVAPKMAEVERLILDSSKKVDLNVTPQTVQLIAENASHLKGLSLKFNKNMGDESTPFLGKLTNLDNLVLRDNGITAAGVKNLTTLQRLTKFYLSGNEIGNAGMEIFYGNFPVVKELSLRGCGVGDAGIGYLENHIQLERLYTNGKRGTELTDNSLPSFTKLVNLQELLLRKSKMTEETVNELRSVLPNTKISTGGTEELRTESK